MKNLLPTFVRVADIASLLDLTERRVHQLAVSGILVRESHGCYRFAESIRGYIRYLSKKKERRDPQEAWYRRIEALEDWKRMSIEKKQI